MAYWNVLESMSVSMFGVTNSRAQQRCLWTEEPHPLS